jgi:hypothetical protein
MLIFQTNRRSCIFSIFLIELSSDRIQPYMTEKLDLVSFISQIQPLVCHIDECIHHFDQLRLINMTKLGSSWITNNLRLVMSMFVRMKNTFVDMTNLRYSSGRWGWRIYICHFHEVKLSVKARLNLFSCCNSLSHYLASLNQIFAWQKIRFEDLNQTFSNRKRVGVVRHCYIQTSLNFMNKAFNSAKYE